MASSSKRSRGSSSTSDNFLSKDNEKAYDKYKVYKITHSRVLIQADLNFNFILTLTHAYNRETFLQFLSNLRVTPNSSRISSFTLQQRVQITKEDLGTYLYLRTEGVRAHNMSLESEYNWTAINRVLRGIDQVCHLSRVYTLPNARIIQHVLRSFIIPKAPNTKRNKNIALGHLVCYVLEKKYNLVHPDPPIEEPIFFTNVSFRVLFNQGHGSDSGGEGEPGQEAVPAPVQEQNAYQKLFQRFDHLETHFDQRFDQLENRLNTQNDQHNADMAWMCGQTDYINTNLAMINSYFTGFAPQPPPDQDPEF
ncbi:hypothetical protein M5K25_026058 [Dendrobium thyrsiflorum]|uniref:Uncharacterized protein n=1 Tax=Dendrobium thyrsiflorum TaxID=117978 RepID=A0ABD0TWC5_DENTH